MDYLSKKTDNSDNPYLDENGVLTLSSGTKLFVAIVNAPAELLAIQNQYLNNNTLNQQALMSETLTFNDLTTIVGKYNNGIVSFTNTNSNNRGFMMTTLDTKGYEEKVLSETADGDTPQDIDLTVGRAMAKVSLGSELEGTVAGSDEAPNGTLEVLSYKIINNPKEMYIMPHYQSGVVISPYYYDDAVRPNSYFDSHNTVLNGDESEENYIPVSQNNKKHLRIV
ncbi:MAG: hypothetical protein LIP01_02390 [Tannerellaceae bacterium]|nr:hypothetical protein [Tannerellaceae bacterium]